MKEKKMTPAAAATPPAPNGAKSARLSASKAVRAMTMNIASTASLITTMIAFVRADSLAPRISSSMHSPTSTTAGRLITPGSLSHGAASTARGSSSPVMLRSASLR
jgi:hypothetical protein